MLRCRPGRVRLATLLVALLQLALPALASVADARLERESESPRAAAHVESPGGHACPRIHPTDCALCQFLSAAGTAPARAPLPLPSPVLAGNRAGNAAPPAVRELRRAALPRAPPGSVAS